MTDSVLSCELPGGVLDEGQRLHRIATVTGLSGREEEILLSSRANPARAVTAVLARCVSRIGDLGPISEDVARDLLVADRVYLLLKLREATFGDQVSGSLRCPWPACGARMSIAFSIRDLPIKTWPRPATTYRCSLPRVADDAVEETVELRLPTGADQEAIAPLLGGAEPAALRSLLARCVVGRADSEQWVANLAPAAQRALEAQLSAAAPAVDLEIVSRCPECSRESSTALDPQDFFFGELQQSVELLYREVHCLAFHYHWSEQEILTMPRERRRRYIDVLEHELERANDA